MSLSQNNSKFLIKIFLIITSLSFNYSYSETFNECFPSKYSFKCEDPFLFLKNHSIDVKKDILEINDFHKTEKPFEGGSTGHIYVDNKNQTYFVKHGNPFTEFIGSRLMNLIVGKQCTPIVKIFKNDPKLVASLKLKNFKTAKDTNIIGKRIRNTTDLAIAMDLLGLVDRHKENMGYVRLDSKTLMAARIDFDASFAFEIKPLLNSHYRPHSDCLNLDLLYDSINHYPKTSILRAMKNIIGISDEKIIMTFFNAGLLFPKPVTTSLSKPALI
ncbi:MAG: hypothetical protein C5B43_04660 [Verrucomicrobia bacterium]|nr:MAG: hypothetical protein C5B43_04660 [Verrucomicrobiota bacterium]